MKRCAVCAIVTAALLGSGAAYGATIDSSWIGGSGNWSTASQWNPAGAPNNANGNVFDVTIASGSVGGDSVLLDTSPTIDSLSIGGTGSPYAEALYTSGTSQTLTVNGAVIINSGGELNLSSGTLSAGTLTDAGGFSLSGSSANATVTGDLTNTGAGSLYVASGSTLTVNGTLTNQNTNSNSFVVDSAVNANTLDNSGYARIYNGGALNLTNGITSVGSGSTLEVDGSLTSGSGSGLAGLNNVAGTLYLENGQTINITPTGGTLNDSGTFLVENNGSGATVANINGSLALAQSGYLGVYSGGTLNLTNSITDIPTGAGVRVDGTTNAVNGLTSIEGYLNLDNGQSTTITPNGGTLANAGSFSLSGAGTSATVAGNLTDTSTGYLSVYSGSTLTVNGTLANQYKNGYGLQIYGAVNANTLDNIGNTLIQNGGALNLTNGITSVASGSTLFVEGSLTSGSGSALAGLNSITGELALENGQITNITPNGGTLNNSGELQIENDPNNNNPTVVNVSGGLALAKGGSVYLGSGATLNLTNSIADIPTGAGVSVYGTTNALAGLNSIEGFLYLDNGQSTTITPTGGTLAIANEWLSVEGSGTNVTIVGNLTNASSSSLYVSPGSTLTVNGTLANQAANGNYLEIDGTANANTLDNGGYTHVVSGGTIYAGSVTNGSGATLTLDGASGSTPGGVLDPLKYTSGGSTSVGSGATLVVGSGTVPSGTTGLYAFDNGTLAELLFRSPNSGNTCTGSASDCGIINVAGNVTLSGTLDPLLQNGFDPMNGDSFIFLTFSGALSGQFSSIADQYFNNDMQQWVLTYGTDSVELTAEAYTAPPPTATPEPATMALFGVGLLGLGLLSRARRKK